MAFCCAFLFFSFTSCCRCWALCLCGTLNRLKQTKHENSHNENETIFVRFLFLTTCRQLSPSLGVLAISWIQIWREICKRRHLQYVPVVPNASWENIFRHSNFWLQFSLILPVRSSIRWRLYWHFVQNAEMAIKHHVIIRMRLVVDEPFSRQRQLFALIKSANEFKLFAFNVYSFLIKNLLTQMQSKRANTRFFASELKSVSRVNIVSVRDVNEIWSC